MDFTFKRRLMDARGIDRALARLGSQIIEHNNGTDNLLLIGIRRRGVPLAERIADKIAQFEGIRPTTGQLDITLYRDDLQTVGPRPVVGRTELPWQLDGKRVVIHGTLTTTHWVERRKQPMIMADSIEVERR